MTLPSLMAVVGVAPSELLLVLGILAVVAGLTVFWLWMLVDCARRISAGETGQLGWLIAICLAQVFGALAYWLFGRHATSAKAG